MKLVRITVLLILLIVANFIVNCTPPPPVNMKNGDKLDKMIKEKKLTVAVLPTIDWSEDEGCCKGYMLYGFLGALTRNRAYSDGAVIVTNEITRSLWKKNKMRLIKNDVLVKKVREANLKAEEIFPRQEYQSCGLYPKPVKGPQEVGQGEPNYQKLYTLGKDLGADILIISRLSRNTKTDYCAQNPVGPISLVDYFYKAQIKKYKNYYIAIDIMALDVNNKEVIAFGYYNGQNLIPEGQKIKAMEQYTKALTFYAPKPAKEDLEKEFLANMSSVAGTYLANYLLQNTLGIGLRIAFKFDYEYGDETWKMYGPDYFEKNYAITRADYESMVH